MRWGRSGGLSRHAARIAPASRLVAGAPRAPTSDRPVTTYEIRILTTVRDLVESYWLRYDTYGALGYLRCSNPSKLEIDPYDLMSIPLGAFDAASGRMVGTLRIVTTELQPTYQRLISRVLTEFADPDLNRQALGSRPHQLPAIVTDEIARQIAAVNTEQRAVHELSRFIVHPDHRSSHVSRGLVQLALAYATRSAPAVLIAGCQPRHVRLYASYGFVQLPHTDVDFHDSVGQFANTIICRSDALPGPMRSQVDALLRAMAEGASEHTQGLCRDSRVLFRLAAPRRALRAPIE
jgi:predicted GNAT family N-acyltransferase